MTEPDNGRKLHPLRNTLDRGVHQPRTQESPSLITPREASIATWHLMPRALDGGRPSLIGEAYVIPSATVWKPRRKNKDLCQ